MRTVTQITWKKLLDLVLLTGAVPNACSATVLSLKKLVGQGI